MPIAQSMVGQLVSPAIFGSAQAASRRPPSNELPNVVDSWLVGLFSHWSWASWASSIKKLKGARIMTRRQAPG